MTGANRRDAIAAVDKNRYRRIMFLSWTRSLSLFLVGMCAVSACKGDDDSGLTNSDRKLNSLSDDEAKEVCDEIKSAMKDSSEFLCKSFLAGSVTDELLDADSCAEEWKACEDEAQQDVCADEGSEGDDDDDDCDISVKDFVSCIEALADFGNDVTPKLSCDDGLSAAHNDELEKMFTSGACKTFAEECVSAEAYAARGFALPSFAALRR
jgi:hypothetical protein